jgi:hypothetical protein
MKHSDLITTWTKRTQKENPAAELDKESFEYSKRHYSGERGVADGQRIGRFSEIQGRGCEAERRLREEGWLSCCEGRDVEELDLPIA